MKWQKTEIQINNLPAFSAQLKDQIKAGNDAIERIRCVYWIKNLDIVQCLMPYDFIDDLDTKPDIIKFQLYQLID